MIQVVTNGLNGRVTKVKKGRKKKEESIKLNSSISKLAQFSKNCIYDQRGSSRPVVMAFCENWHTDDDVWLNKNKKQCLLLVFKYSPKIHLNFETLQCIRHLLLWHYTSCNPPAASVTIHTRNICSFTQGYLFGLIDLGVRVLTSIIPTYWAGTLWYESDENSAFERGLRDG